jgi:hypothetical protein
VRSPDAKHAYVNALTGIIINIMEPIIKKNVPDDVFLSVHEKLEELISREYVEVEDRKLPPELKNQDKSCKKN